VKRIALLVVPFACVIGLGYAATLAGHTLQITIRDFCDKNTCPAGLCTGNGKIAFAAFNAELAAFKDAGSWKFVPDVATTEGASTWRSPTSAARLTAPLEAVVPR
jgi:hypothetical protein